MDRFDTARKGNLDRAFQNDVLSLLERIAVALENQSSYSPPLASLVPQDDVPRYNPDAGVCTCGNDPKKACTQCTPARMAWVYNMNPGWGVPE